MPNDEHHACRVCGVEATGFDDLDLAFGFRRMGDDHHSVRIQSYCHRCRGLDQEARDEQTRKRELFEGLRGHQPGVVYAIYAIDRGLTKIGFTAAHPDDRLRSFQTACPDRLTLIGWYPSPYYGERQAHAELHDRHFRGEWFEMDAAEARDWLAAHEDHQLEGGGQ
jgi:hypothetical protein